MNKLTTVAVSALTLAIAGVALPALASEPMPVSLSSTALIANAGESIGGHVFSPDHVDVDVGGGHWHYDTQLQPSQATAAITANGSYSFTV